MNEIIMRTAVDEYDAVTVSQAMEEASASVFSIVKIHESLPKFAVYAKFQNPITPDDIDMEINYLREKMSKLK